MKLPRLAFIFLVLGCVVLYLTYVKRRYENRALPLSKEPHKRPTSADVIGESFQYGIMFDAGSTGTRIHVFQFRVEANEAPKLTHETFRAIKPGLSAYADDPDKCTAGLLQLLEVAKEVVPAGLWPSTPLALKATAGLRLLPGEKASHLLDKVKEVFGASPFLHRKDSVSIMDGTDEGMCSHLSPGRSYIIYKVNVRDGGVDDREQNSSYFSNQISSRLITGEIVGSPGCPLILADYRICVNRTDLLLMQGLSGIWVSAWITVNFLLGGLHGSETPTVGMLDLGGGSTQITFSPQDEKTIQTSPIDYVTSFQMFNTSHALYSHRPTPVLVQSDPCVGAERPLCWDMPTPVLGHADPCVGTCRPLCWDMPTPVLVQTDPCVGTCRPLCWDMPTPVLGHADPCVGTCRPLCWDMPTPVLGQTDPCVGTDRPLCWDMPTPVLGHADPCVGAERPLCWDMPTPVLGHADPCVGADRPLCWDMPTPVLVQSDPCVGADRPLCWGRPTPVLGHADPCVGTCRPLCWDRATPVLGQSDPCVGTERPLCWDLPTPVLGPTDPCVGTERPLCWDRATPVLGQSDPCVGTERPLCWDRATPVLGQSDPCVGTERLLCWDILKGYLGLGLMSARLAVLGGIEGQPVASSLELVSPCLAPDYTGQWEHAEVVYKLKGQKAGEPIYESCLSKVEKMIYKRIRKAEEVKFMQFYAFSYYYDRAVDLGLIDDNTGGSVKVSDYIEGAKTACKNMEAGAGENPFLCLDLTYISVLLQELGFPLDKELKLARKINDVETSWALGATFYYMESLHAH
ncbi:hypothetical protein NFI96_012720 [Prochilodus magdalenae]|nr:hypothetical protein NFI96_012720 [Prochilodus magdalenae]